MPYTWTTHSTETELQLWPHQSLDAPGYVRVLSFAALMLAVPLLMVLGSSLLWGLLPFLLLALLGLKWALDRNRHDHQRLEILTLDPTHAHLDRLNPDQSRQDWHCNRYWVTVHLLASGGRIPNYIILRGNGRDVEIGAFLTPEERTTLYAELCDAFQQT